MTILTAYRTFFFKSAEDFRLDFGKDEKRPDEEADSDFIERHLESLEETFILHYDEFMDGFTIYELEL